MGHVDSVARFKYGGGWCAGMYSAWPVDMLELL